jgi:hypothetical protein
MKKIISYFSIYFTGVVMTSSFILYSNDMFYENVIKKLFIDKNFDKKTWDKIKPREIYGNSAKDAYLNPKHSLINDDPNQTSKDYNDFISKKKEQEVEYEKIKQNIFNKKI